MPRYDDDDERDFEPRNRYEDIWEESVSQYIIDHITHDTGYSEREIIQAHLEIYLAIPGIADTPRGEKYELWQDYLDSMVEGAYKQDRFFDLVGISKGDFDWHAWREAMGYPHGGRK
jgi:hypothetical protein